MLRKLTVVLAAMAAAVAFAPAANATTGAVPTKTTAVLAPEIAIPARATISTCEAGYLCFWVHADYLGQRGRFAGNNAHWSNFPQSTCPDGNWNDCASSAKNRGTSCTAHLHQHSSYGGDRHSIGRGGDRAHLSNHNFNDKTSSNSWC